MTRLPHRIPVSPALLGGIAVLALGCALVAASGYVSYTGSDPRGTLLTAQALVEHGTFALDAYPGVPADYRIMKHRGRTFYAYPPGTPFLAAPAVALARLAGMDMTRAEDDDRLQRTLAAASVGLVAALAALVACQWLPPAPALMLAGIFVLGTPVISTMATALWSTNAVVAATMAALLLLSRFDATASGPRVAAVAGGLLGFAFWCRPPAFLVAGLVVVWVLARATTTGAARRSAVRDALILVGAVLVVSPGLLVLMSRLTYGTWLPEYYTGLRAASSDRFWTALAAHLVSPSRGLLIFAPVAALAVAGTLVWGGRVLRFPLAALAAVWLVLHLLLVSRFPYWWGGYGYGSRLMVDALPAVFLLLCAVAAIARGSSRWWRVGGMAALVLAGASGIWINAVQGLFNRSTADWNVSPDIDAFPGYAFDWRFPQFLATPARLAERMRRHERWVLPSLEPDVDYTGGSPALDLAAASVRFLVTEHAIRGSGRMMLTLALGSEHAASVDLRLNGRPLARLGLKGTGPELLVVGIPRNQIRTLEYDIRNSNVLEWRDVLEWRGTPGGPGGPGSIRFWGLRLHVLR